MREGLGSARRAVADARATWFGDLAASLAGLEVYGMAIVAVDARSGRILAATARAVDLFGGPFPPTLADLVEAGSIARPDLIRLARHLKAWRALDDLETDGRESSHSWSDLLRIHRTGAAALELRLEVVVHRRAAIDAEAAIVTVWPADGSADPTWGHDHPPAGELSDLWAVYDADYLMVAADPGFADLSIEPRSQLGNVAWLYVHPDDVPAVQPLVAAVLAGRYRTARYSARVRARGGRWLPADLEVRRLDTATGPQLLVVAHYVDETRQIIPPDLLSAREQVVVDALFAGLRVSQIAAHEGVAVKTVRNQLAAIYRKLGVAGQLDLLASYHPRARPGPEAGPRDLG